MGVNASQLHRIASRGQVQELQQFLQTDTDYDINAKCSQGATPLIHAIYFIEEEQVLKQVAELLIQHGADDGDSTMHLVAKYNRLSVLHLLLSTGKCTCYNKNRNIARFEPVTFEQLCNAAEDQNELGYTPADRARHRKHLEMANILDAFAVEKDGYTASILFKPVWQDIFFNNVTSMESEEFIAYVTQNQEVKQMLLLAPYYVLGMTLARCGDHNCSDEHTNSIVTAIMPLIGSTLANNDLLYYAIAYGYEQTALTLLDKWKHLCCIGKPIQSAYHSYTKLLNLTCSEYAHLCTLWDLGCKIDALSAENGYEQSILHRTTNMDDELIETIRIFLLNTPNVPIKFFGAFQSTFPSPLSDSEVDKLVHACVKAKQEDEILLSEIFKLGRFRYDHLEKLVNNGLYLTLQYCITQHSRIVLKLQTTSFPLSHLIETCRDVKVECLFFNELEKIATNESELKNISDMKLFLCWLLMKRKFDLYHKFMLQTSVSTLFTHFGARSNPLAAAIVGIGNAENMELIHEIVKIPSLDPDQLCRGYIEHEGHYNWNTMVPAIFIAARVGNMSIVKYLVETCNSAHYNKAFVMVKMYGDSSRVCMTAADIAQHNGHSEVSKFLDTYAILKDGYTNSNKCKSFAQLSISHANDTVKATRIMQNASLFTTFFTRDPLQVKREKQANTIAAMFKALDTNNDQTLDLKEISLLAQALSKESNNIGITKFMEIVQHCDANGDGVIDAAEFSTLVSNHLLSLGDETFDNVVSQLEKALANITPRHSHSSSFKFLNFTSVEDILDS